jgi:hypothetical protein
MKADATACKSTRATTNSIERQSHGGRFTKVLDGRKQPIRGLWARNGRYYALNLTTPIRERKWACFKKTESENEALG